MLSYLCTKISQCVIFINEVHSSSLSGGLNPANKDRAAWSGVGWTGKDLLVCTIADCTDKGVAPPTFGTRKAVTVNSKTGDGKSTTFGSVVSFQCNTGYVKQEERR